MDMSDDFFMCPVCGVYDAVFEIIDDDEKYKPDKYVRCRDCKSIIKVKDILVEHIEYER